MRRAKTKLEIVNGNHTQLVKALDARRAKVDFNQKAINLIAPSRLIENGGKRAILDHRDRCDS